VHEECYGNVNEDCARNAHRLMGTPWKHTQECMNNAFYIPNGRPFDYDQVSLENEGNAAQLRDPRITNNMIDHEMEYYEKYGPQLYPALVINNQTFRGQLEVEAVFNAICAGFYTEPDYCKKYLETNDINNIDLILMHNTHRKHGFLKVFVVCFSIMSVIGCMLFCYRRSAKRNMQKQMKE